MRGSPAVEPNQIGIKVSKQETLTVVAGTESVGWIYRLGDPDAEPLVTGGGVAGDPTGIGCLGERGSRRFGGAAGNRQQERPA